MSISEPIKTTIPVSSICQDARLDQKAGRPTSHSNDPEILLIRIGHWLWKWHKAARGIDPAEAKVNLAACESVWAAKETYRAPLRAQAEINRAAKAERMRENVRKQAA